MANLINQWLNPNNFAVIRDKFNAVWFMLSGGQPNQVLAKYGTGNGEANWFTLFDLMPTGQPWYTYQSDLTQAPFNGKWLSQDGKTLSNSSGTGDYKGDVYKPLFLFLWNTFSDTITPVSGGRGVDAESDYSANKKIALPDTRGRSRIAYDSRTSDPSNNIWDFAYTAMGGKFGEKSHKIVVGEGSVEDHDHSVLMGNVDGGNPGVKIGIATGSVQSLGQGYDDTNVSGGAKDAQNAHNTVHPVYAIHDIIKI